MVRCTAPHVLCIIVTTDIPTTVYVFVIYIICKFCQAHAISSPPPPVQRQEVLSEDIHLVVVDLLVKSVRDRICWPDGPDQVRLTWDAFKWGFHVFFAADFRDVDQLSPRAHWMTIQSITCPNYKEKDADLDFCLWVTWWTWVETWQKGPHSDAETPWMDVTFRVNMWANAKTGENINLKLSAVYLICLLSNP